MAKQLLIVADDFGACKEINDGIIKCAEAGSIDCVDAFVTFGEQSKQAIQEFQQKFAEQLANGSLRLGLHLTLTCGYPVSGNSKDRFRKNIIYPDNASRRKTGFAHRLKMLTDQKIGYINEHFQSEIAREIQAQYELFVDITGMNPAHVSCHEGFFHLTKNLSYKYFPWVMEKNLFTRNPCLISLQDNLGNVWYEYTLMQQKANKNAFSIIAEIGPLEANKIRNWTTTDLPVYRDQCRPTLKTTDFFLDHFYGQGTITSLERIFSKLDEAFTYEMVVHPVWFEEEEFEAPDLKLPGIDYSTFYNRKIETTTLTGEIAKQLYNKYSVERFKLPT